MQPLPSLPEHVLNHLRQGLASGAWKNTLPGERRLAEELRISRPTLRVALAQLKREGWLRVENRKTFVCERKAARAGRAAEASRHRRVVFLSPREIEEMPSSSLVVSQILSEGLAEGDATLRVLTCKTMLSDRPEPALRKVMQEARADGWILFRAPLAVQKFFESAGVPCALFGNPHPGITLPSVSFEFASLARHAALVLRRLGHAPHRIFVVVSDNSMMAGNAAVERGVSEALGGAKFGVIRYREDHSNLGRLCDAALNLPERPTAFIVHRPSAALHVASRALSAHGLGIPRDLSVLCLEDSVYLAAFHPEIARYHHSYPLLARSLCKSIQALMAGNRRSNNHKDVFPDLIQGGSLAPPKVSAAAEAVG